MAPKGKGKKKADPDEPADEEPPAKKLKPEKAAKEDKPEKAAKPEKEKKKPMRRPDHGEIIYCVEYAASNRSTCSVSGQKIEKGVVRLGLAVPGKGDWDAISWRLPEFHMEPLEVSEEETLTSASQIERYDTLEKKDQEVLDKWFAKASKMPRKERTAPEPTAEGGAESALPGTTITATFKERDEVCGLGAKFDYNTRSFYIPFGKDATPFTKWLGDDAALAIGLHNSNAPTEGGAGGSKDVPMAEAPPARPAIAPEAVAKLGVPALKEELKARGIDASGNKADLVGRLQGAMEAPPAAAAGSSAAEPPANAHGRRVDRAVEGGDQYAVYEEYDVKMSEASIVDGANVNKYYFCQVLQKAGGTFAAYFKWGKTGEVEFDHQLKPCADVASAIKLFEKKFNDKTRGAKDKSPPGEAWAEYKAGNFEKRDGYYGVIETKTDPNSAGDDDWQKNLDDKQIEKGMAALSAIKSALSDEDQAQDASLIAKLSTEYYRAIPTSAGRKAPPPLDNLAVVGEKEHQLEFWLRMGFEDTGALSDNPIKGLWELPLPSTLKEACTPYGVSDTGSINSSVARGKRLSIAKAGKPIKPMNGDKYGAIVLYTGNSCYRELNTALRQEHKNVPKFMSYLRLLFEAMDHMPTAKVRLWRGIAADLYTEYEPGKVITWWSVSSTTADESVARGFMSQLGGVASLIVLDTKSALDITPLSVYPNEKESLLAPGTRLKVISRKRVGNINEIHVEEVDTAVEPRPASAVAPVPAAGAAVAEEEDETEEHPYSGFSVEPAKSNRSTCKECGTKIDKGELRIGCELEDLDGSYGGHTITQWRKATCVKPSWIKLDELKGFSNLDKKAKAAIEKLFKKKK